MVKDGHVEAMSEYRKEHKQEETVNLLFSYGIACNVERKIERGLAVDLPAFPGGEEVDCSSGIENRIGAAVVNYVTPEIPDVYGVQKVLDALKVEPILEAEKGVGRVEMPKIGEIGNAMCNGDYQEFLKSNSSL
jgi:hypothetical protein